MRVWACSGPGRPLGTSGSSRVHQGLHWLSLCLLCCLGFILAAPCSAAAPIQGLPSGQRLLYNANSLFLRNRQYTAGACSRLCGRLPGCNAWAFCTSRTGCGRQCSTLTANTPRLGPDPSQVGQAYWNLRTPLSRMGYWTHPTPGGRGCQGDAWAYATCQLLKVPNVNKLTMTSKAASRGWVSGTVTPNPRCPNALPTLCADCDSSPHPAICRACVNSIPVGRPLAALLAPGTTRQGACLACARLSDANTASRCAGCLRENKPCAACALRQAEPAPVPELASCVECSHTDTPRNPQYPRAPTLTDVCVHYSSRLAQPLRANSMTCLRAFRGTICKGGQFGSHDCTYPSSAQATCDSCAARPWCLTCLSKAGSRCFPCLNPAYPTDNCLGCVAAIRPGCIPCMEPVYSGTNNVATGEEVYSYYLSPSCLQCYGDKTVRNTDYCTTCNFKSMAALNVFSPAQCNACIRNASVPLTSCAARRP